MAETFLEAVDSTQLRIARSGSNRPYALGVFVRPDVVDGTDRVIMSKDNQGNPPGADGFEWSLQLTSGNQWIWNYADATTFYGVGSSGLTIAAGTWWLLIAQMSEQGGSEARSLDVFPLGGARTTYTNVHPQPTSKTSSLKLGCGINGTTILPDFFAHCRVDSMGIWHGRGLNTSDMDELHNAGAGRNFGDLTANLLTGLVEWWDFDEPTGDLTWPARVNGNDFTVTQGTAIRQPKRGL